MIGIYIRIKVDGKRTFRAAPAEPGDFEYWLKSTLAMQKMPVDGERSEEQEEDASRDPQSFDPHIQAPNPVDNYELLLLPGCPCSRQKKLVCLVKSGERSVDYEHKEGDRQPSPSYPQRQPIVVHVMSPALMLSESKNTPAVMRMSFWRHFLS